MDQKVGAIPFDGKGEDIAVLFVTSVRPGALDITKMRFAGSRKPQKGLLKERFWGSRGKRLHPRSNSDD